MKMRRDLPALMLTIIVAILIWVFGTFVFIPLAEGIMLLGEFPLDTIVSIIILIALLVVVLRAVAAIIRISDSISMYFATEVGRRQAENMDRNSVTRFRSFFRAIIYTVVLVLVFILLQQYMNMISPILSGIVLLAIVLVSVYFLYTGGAAIAGETTRMMESASSRATGFVSDVRGQTESPPPSGGQRQTPA
jgi:hypothetical protein